MLFDSDHYFFLITCLVFVTTALTWAPPVTYLVTFV